MPSRKRSLATCAAAVAIAGIATAAVRKTRRLQQQARELGEHVPRGPYEAVVKRPLDAVLAAAALAVLSPVMAATALAVRVKLGSPVIFKQERIGLNEKAFLISKFRSMSDEVDESGVLLPDEQRKTSFGSMLRSLSLDELPELFSIVNGDMAIVGPRPLLVDYLPYFKPEERIRHEVRGGLTVPEVLSGRTHTTWNEQLACEAEYARNVTFLTDCKIIVATIGVIFSRLKSNYGADVRKPLSEERGSGFE